MSRDSRIDEIRSFIAGTFGGAADGPGEDEPLLGDLLDSMGVLSLAAHLEDRYGITIAAHEMDPSNFGTLRSLADFVGRKTGKG